jgi:hypothetical protein
VTRQPQCERQGTLFALGRLTPSVAPVKNERNIVALRADR